MSDLFENLQTNKPFDADDFVREKCKGTKIIIPSGIEIKFEFGWKDIFEKFLEEISSFHVFIYKISDVYDLLDIKLEIQSKRKVFVVWQALYEAHWESEKICANCGIIFIRRSKFTIIRYCEGCNKSAALLNNTGTWIDDY